MLKLQFIQELNLFTSIGNHEKWEKWVQEAMDVVEEKENAQTYFKVENLNWNEDLQSKTKQNLNLLA